MMIRKSVPSTTVGSDMVQGGGQRALKFPPVMLAISPKASRESSNSISSGSMPNMTAAAFCAKASGQSRQIAPFHPPVTWTHPARVVIPEFEFTSVSELRCISKFNEVFQMLSVIRQISFSANFILSSRYLTGR